MPWRVGHGYGPRHFFDPRERRPLEVKPNGTWPAYRHTLPALLEFRAVELLRLSRRNDQRRHCARDIGPRPHHIIG